MENLKTEFDIIERRAEIIWSNGFGFQPMGEKFVIASLEKEISSTKLEKISQESGAKTVDNCDWIGRDYLIVQWTEYQLIDKILNSLLSNQISFGTWDRFNVIFDWKNDCKYSREIAEFKFIDGENSLIERLGLFRYFDCIKVNSGRKHATKHEFNYLTEKGKIFCRNLRKELYNNGLIKHETCCKPVEHNHFNWNIFKNYPSITFGIHVPQTPQSPQNQQTDENLCMICFTNPPNTIVLPCRHCVVCQICSEGLKNTNDKNICVACRNPINSIEECT